MPGHRDQNHWSDHKEDREGGERRPWEGYRPRGKQAPDYGSAGGQYFSRVGPDQDPYTPDEGAYAGVRNRDYGGQGNYDPERYGQASQHDWEREGRGGRGGYGQVGGRRETARDEGGYSRGSRYGGQRHVGQGGYGEEQNWGRDRGDFSQYGQGGFDPARGNPPDSQQLAYGPGSQSYGQALDDHDAGGQHGYGQHDHGQHDTDYRRWRSDQARKYDEDYGSWRESQLRQHDDDYSKWKSERREKFGKDFSDWNSSRSQSSASSQNQGQSGSPTGKGLKP